MPEEAKTLEELIAVASSLAPQLDDVAWRIIKENPNVKRIDSNGTEGFMLGKIIGIALLDFLVYAYGKGTRGYIHPFPKN